MDAINPCVLPFVCNVYVYIISSLVPSVAEDDLKGKKFLVYYCHGTSLLKTLLSVKG